MKKYVFRNTAIEYLFDDSFLFSGYSDVSIEDGYDEYYFCYFLDYTNSREEILKCIEKAKYNLDYICSKIKDKKIYVFTLYNYFNRSVVISNNDIENAISEFNNYIYSLGNNVYVIDIKEFYMMYNSVFDLRFYFNYNSIISPKLKKEFFDWFSLKYNLINATRKKCLVVDFDNTIWNGILGEDGVDGIGFNGFYPNNVYGEVQKLIKEIKNSGTILCAATKNNITDIEELFKKRSDLYLKKEDFTIIKAGWDNKANSISEIVKQLNIGLDSVVFIDDNKFEIELVNSTLSDVTTILLPNEKYLIPSFINKELLKYFSLYNLSSDDLKKSEMYKNLQLAEELKLSVSDYNDYLKELNMQLEINYMNESNIDRIVQLINKSNQFNLTTKRYSKEELLLSLKKDDLVYCINVKDKFGDLGICGVCCIKELNNNYMIDEFLLSCRVLGRTIENEFLKVIINDLYEKGIKQLHGEYVKTLKNSQVENFYDKFGFENYEVNEENKKYKIDVKEYKLNNVMEVVFNGK